MSLDVAGSMLHCLSKDSTNSEKRTNNEE